MPTGSFSELLAQLPEQPGDLGGRVEACIAQARIRARAEYEAAVAAADALKAAGRQDLHDRILLSLPLEQLTEWRSRKNYKRIPLGVSFAAGMSQYRQFTRAMSALQGIGPTRRLFQKRQGQDFARRLGLQVAAQIQTDVRLEDLSPRPGTLVKPTRDSGSRGVILCRRDGTFFDLRNKITLHGPDAVRDSLRQGMASGYLLSKRFHLEELLEGEDGATPPHDLKFYTFYGKVGLVLEVRRGTVDRHCFYVDGTETETGKYPDALFSGQGFPPEWEALAARISLKVPLPFLRIDFYRTAQGLYAGEFTSAPGNYEGFNLQFDRHLGWMLAEAQARLHHDLLHGARFDEYRAFIDPNKEEIPA